MRRGCVPPPMIIIEINDNKRRGGGKRKTFVCKFRNTDFRFVCFYVALNHKATRPHSPTPLSPRPRRPTSLGRPRDNY